MADNIDIFSNYTLAAINEQMPPLHTFLRDRYFPSGAGDFFTTEEVLAEFQEGDNKMAWFVAPRVGDINVDRSAYRIDAYKPAYVGLSRITTVDDLKHKLFGEAIFSGMTPQQRQIRLLERDMRELDERITRREEWMAAQVLTNNACTMTEYLDADTPGETNTVQFYDTTSDHTYTVASADRWDTANGDIFGDVEAMCDELARRNLPAVDLLLGTKAAKAFLSNQKVRELLNKDSGIIVGQVDATITAPGVRRLGTLNFNGYELNVFVIHETYNDGSNPNTPYFPAKGAVVTAPNCGHTMYGAINQIEVTDGPLVTRSGRRIPKAIITQATDSRKFRLACRPLVAPRTYCPFIYAADVVS